MLVPCKTLPIHRAYYMGERTFHNWRTVVKDLICILRLRKLWGKLGYELKAYKNLQFPDKIKKVVMVEDVDKKKVKSVVTEEDLDKTKVRIVVTVEELDKKKERKDVTEEDNNE